jgi:hypothetical protein
MNRLEGFLGKDQPPRFRDTAPGKQLDSQLLGSLTSLGIDVLDPPFSVPWIHRKALIDYLHVTLVLADKNLEYQDSGGVAKIATLSLGNRSMT